MSKHRKEEEKESYRLEVDHLGQLLIVTDYPNGFFSEYIVTSVIEVNDILYFVSI